MPELTLSVLDQSPISAGGDGAQAIAETLALARHCDGLGFHRYWLAEHHGTPALAGSSPEILIARVAGLTEHMRIGAGGAMVNHYTAMKVAENFRLLEALFPGRVDLGLGRAPGGDRWPDRDYFHHLQHLLELLDEPNDRPGSGRPEVWMLGASAHSARHAAALGLPYSYAHFINQQGGAALMSTYQQAFQASQYLAQPAGSIAAFVICADTQEEADRLALSREGFLVSQRTGIPGPIPAPETVRGTAYTAPQQRMMAHIRNQSIIGPPEKVRAQLLLLAHAHGAEEVVVLTITHAFEARLRSYQLLAEIF